MNVTTAAFWQKCAITQQKTALCDAWKVLIDNSAFPKAFVHWGCFLTGLAQSIGLGSPEQVFGLTIDRSMLYKCCCSNTNVKCEGKVAEMQHIIVLEPTPYQLCIVWQSLVSESSPFHPNRNVTLLSGSELCDTSQMLKVLKSKL